VSLVVAEGRVTRIYAMRNPDKLGSLEKVAELRR
jgi:RNA polymerase sigma-70 factor (ECF subfamily)